MATEISNVKSLTVCRNCGGTMVGDGYTIVLHCEYADCPEDIEPDGKPVYCEVSSE